MRGTKSSHALYKNHQDCHVACLGIVGEVNIIQFLEGATKASNNTVFEHCEDQCFTVRSKNEKWIGFRLMG